MRLTDNEKRDLVKLIEAGKPLPDGFRLFANWFAYWAAYFAPKSKPEIIRVRDDGKVTAKGRGDFAFENEWQSFRTRKSRGVELTSAFHEFTPGPRKVAVKVVDIFGNDTMWILG